MSHDPYLERETGLEPATLCLGIGWVAFLATPEALRQFLPEKGPFWASDSGRAEHLIESVDEPCQSVKPSDFSLAGVSTGYCQTTYALIRISPFDTSTVPGAQIWIAFTHASCR